MGLINSTVRSRSVGALQEPAMHNKLAFYCGFRLWRSIELAYYIYGSLNHALKSIEDETD